MNRAPEWIKRDREFMVSYLEHFEGEVKKMVHKTIREFETQEREDVIAQREQDDAEDDARQYQIREDIRNGELYRD